MMVPLLASALIGCLGLVLLVVTPSGSATDSIVHEFLSAECDRERCDSKRSVVPHVESRTIAWIAGGLLFGIVRLCFPAVHLSGFLLSCIVGGAFGELWRRRRRVTKARKLLRQCERNLPVVMERIVMAVSTGLDIIPALGEAARGGRDPVSEDLERIVALAEGGAPVDDAIRGVSENSPSPAVKHALIHLRLAHQQGGELVRPLKELSDATQTAYQEVVEEEIAKLPVKAVMPLMLTFAGLIVCFLTVPFIQVGVIASKVTHAAR